MSKAFVRVVLFVDSKMSTRLIRYELTSATDGMVIRTAVAASCDETQPTEAVDARSELSTDWRVNLSIVNRSETMVIEYGETVMEGVDVVVLVAVEVDVFEVVDVALEVMVRVLVVEDVDDRVLE